MDVKRTIVSANQPLPGRDYTYPFSVMVIHLKNGANKIQFPQPDITQTENDKEVTRTFRYNLQRNGKRYSWPIKRIAPKEEKK